MRILITGGAGFIGQYLAAALCEEHDLLALDALVPQVHADAAGARARFPGPVVAADVSEPDAWAALERYGPFDVVVHLAAETGTGQSMYEAERYRRVNVAGTDLAGRAAARWDAALVAMSSRAVYGNGRFGCARHGERYSRPCCDAAQPAASRESDPHHPVSVYGQTKSDGEQVLHPLADRVPVTILRPQNVVGFGQALHNPYTGVLAAFLARLREGRPLSVYGDGSATRDFIHVGDVAAHLAWVVRNPGEVGQARVLNSGTGVRTTLTHLAHTARAAAPGGAASAPLEYVEVHRAGDIDHALADLTRADEAGLPRATMTSDDAVSDFITRSWLVPGADSSAWDDALQELGRRGLTS